MEVHSGTTASAASVAEAVPQRPRPLRMLWITAAWGACFVVIEWGLRDAPLLWYAALRALVAGAALVALGAIQRRPTPRSARAWGLITVLGLVNVTLAFSTMFAGVAGGATGTAAVLANAQPLMILLPAWWLYGEKLSPRTTSALVVGFAGLVLVALPGGGGSGAALSLLSAVAVTAGTLLSRRLVGLDLVTATGWHLLIGGVALAGLAAAVEGAPVINWTPRFVVSLAFLALVGTAATTVAWFGEARRSRLDTLTTWTFLTPVLGIALAAVLLGERPGGWTAAGLLAVLAAMWITLRPPRRTTTPAQTTGPPEVGFVPDPRPGISDSRQMATAPDLPTEGET
ncbi:MULTISPECIES: DMT family transporter [unclassified Pseudactinotalea]|uniref:DMT family transporter n=1 Tax=Micrococcales TaxID=85006 RepID=UPI003C7C485A